MTDGESPTPRRRPSYGLPGPTSPAAEPSGASAPGAPSYGTSSFGSPSYDAAPQGSPMHGTPSLPPQTGPLPSSGAPGPRRRRGLWPLIIGLVLLVVIGPAATIGGIVWGVSSMVGDSTSPTVLDGGTGEVEVSQNQMLLLYVPSADAGGECTAEGAEPGSVQLAPTSGSVTFPDGTQYEQKAGVVALEDTTVTVTCTGTDAPAYLGPYSVLGIAGPILIGPIIGLLAGLVGLVLTIVGIVLLVRSRRS